MSDTRQNVAHFTPQRRTRHPRGHADAQRDALQPVEGDQRGAGEEPIEAAWCCARPHFELENFKKQPCPAPAARAKLHDEQRSRPQLHRVNRGD